MSDPRSSFSAELDAYLDGAMSAEERARFEQRAGSDPELARELALQRTIDERLRALMTPPAPFPLPAISHAENPSAIPIASGGGTASSRRLVRLAALLAICALTALAVLTRPWGYLLGPDPSDVAANRTYTELVNGGLKPAWVCGSDEEFRKYTKQKLGQPLAIERRPGLELVGWTYTGGLLDSSAEVLMCRADGNPVIVIMGKKSEDRRMHADTGSGVLIHRKLVGDVVMYELSKSEQPLVVDRITPAP